MQPTNNYVSVGITPPTDLLAAGLQTIMQPDGLLVGDQLVFGIVKDKRRNGFAPS